MDDLLDTANKQHQAALRLEIYALKNIGTESEKQLASLQAYFYSKAAAAYHDLKATEVKKNINAVRSTAYLKGRLDEYLKMLEQIKGTNNACPIDTSASDSGATRRADNLGSVQYAIKLSDIEKKDRTMKALTEEGFTNIQHNGNVGDSVQAADGNNKCRLMLATQTEGLAHTNALATGITAMPGYLQLKTTATMASLAAEENLKSTPNEEKKAWVDAYKHAGQTNFKTRSDYGNETTELHKRDTLLTATKATVKQVEGHHPQTTAAQVTAYFGGKEPNKPDAFLNLVDKDKILKGIAGLQDDTFIRQITNTEQLNQILSYYVYHASLDYSALRKKLEETTKKKDPKAAADLRNKITDKNECNSKPYCSYNKSAAESDKKCKFNETKANKNGAPVTQTQNGGAETTIEKCKTEPEKD
uniref:Variant surface glycoprotein 1125.2604 n=1 Tax=Trypanosoma brucei TaxID=5691 RepID=A0A1J0R8D3_9TRYP|nr:variant surface glycoprotein 1125.2604 [Trypanosoma brucei]